MGSKPFKQDIMKYLVIADIGMYDVVEYYLFGIFNTRQEAEDYIKNNPDPFNLGEYSDDDPHFRFGDLEWHYKHSIKEFDGATPTFVGSGYRWD